MSKKDKNNQNINSIPKYLLGNYFKKPIKWLAHLINDYGNSKHPLITTGTSYAYAIGDEKRRHPELTELQVRENIDLRIKQNRKKLGLPTENTPSLAAAGLALGSFYYPWLAIPDIIFDTAASIDEPSTSNNLHTIADFPETVAKFTPSKIDDYVAKGVLTLGNIDDAVSTSGRNMFSIFDKKTGKINNTIDKTSVRESTNIRYRKNGGQIRKMQTAAGGPLFPWQLNTEWVNDWKFRTTPASRSRVISGKGVETDKQYTERRKKETTKKTWRSDAADIAHEIGEGVLALHPYTAIPYFGAKVGLDFLNGNVSWQTALNASVPLFHLSPQAVGLKEATNVALEDAANAGSKTARNWRVAREIKLATKNKPKHTEVPSKNLFRAKVYKGGYIKDPNSAFFTTDIKYARQYGPAQEYIIETKNPAFTKEPMMGYRDPVSLDMFVYEATKNNPEATMIIGHDANTGEFAYLSNGMEMLSLSPNNIIKTGQRRPMNKTYPVYLGPKHSIKEVVNADGTINPRAAMRIQHEIAGYFDGYKMEHRLEDPRWHRNDPTTYQHTKNVAKSAWGIDTPIGFTKLDQMVAAIGHDFGKMVSGDGHAQIGADLLKLVFPDITEALYKAIAEHMEVPTTPLGKVTKQADIRNGVTRIKQDNGKIRLSLPSSTEKAPRQIVLEPSQVGDNKYYVHIRTWDDVLKLIPARISEYDKRLLFDALYDELPEGAEILFPKSGPGNYATRGTVAGLQHLSMDPRFTPGTKGTLQYLDKDGKTVKTYQGTSYIKKRRGNIFNNSEPLTIEQILNFIDNDIIPRLKELGHQVESYKPNVRTADFLNDIFDLKMRGENGGAWFSPSTNDITLRGPLENQDFGLVIHETGGHGIRYNMQSDYKPVSRQAINEYLADPDNPAKQEPLLKGHFGNEVFNEFEINTLADSYPEIASYFNNFINRLSGKKLSPEALAKRIRHEQGAVNTQFRAKLSENGRLTGKALNKKIQETPEGVILRMEIEQGYTSAGILERISKITGVSMDELNFYNPASLQKLTEKFPELKIIANKVKYAMTHVAGYTAPTVGGYTLYNLLNNLNNQLLEYRKQGGKMNILEFLKNGSGIHIKKKNRGKFTSYCGGKVTDECIRKAKASGNPTLVKRATFALNSRKWKHKEGGSIEKLEKGSWIKNSLSFLNKSGLGKTLLEGGLSFLLSNSQNKSIAGATDVAKAELDKEKQEASDYALLMATKKALEMLLMDPNNPNAFRGSIVLNYIRLQLYNEYLNSINLDIANRKALLDMLSLLMLSENTSGAISGIIQSGLGVVGNLLGGKKDTPSTNSTTYNGTSSSTKSIVLPKLTSNKWTPSTSLSNPVLGNNALGSMPNYTSLLNVKK